ncbi:hypothetical protein [Ancylobacter sp. SL191]|uniref:hypothetical protein n=1 Tax=Ancylobacter sp. SL191 TaxID=2995166 RepID=UPI00227143A9|nr:hypothetical protein [Ancylobacter sp. SL191]WAC27509.1 hypothetical protein OU996_21345 [Ancylobacter sp. SL191]
MNAHTREFVMVERQRLRERAERTIEALIVLLDELDGDPDEEDGGDDEPDSDREYDPSEDGIADAEGMVEQWGGVWNGWRVE